MNRMLMESQGVRSLTSGERLHRRIGGILTVMAAAMAIAGNLTAQTPQSTVITEQVSMRKELIMMAASDLTQYVGVGGQVPVTVLVKDRPGKWVPGVKIVFKIAQGGGTIGGGSQAEAVTGNDGTATVMLTAGAVPGETRVTAEATANFPEVASVAASAFTITVVKVDLKVTHPQKTGPTGSPAKYSFTPNTGSADNLYSTWLNEQFRVDVNIQPAELLNNLPAGFFKWTSAGFTIPDNSTAYTFSWGTTGVKDITVQSPSCGITERIRVDVPDVGILNQAEAALLVGPAASVLILGYSQEAEDYTTNNYPISPQRDAVRHSYWNSLSVSNILVAQVQMLLVSTAHEHDNRDVSQPRQQAFNSTMDLYNNAVGATIYHTTFLALPDRTAILNDITLQYTSGGLCIWAGGGAQENSEGILVKSNGAKFYSDN